MGAAALVLAVLAALTLLLTFSPYPWGSMTNLGAVACRPPVCSPPVHGRPLPARPPAHGVHLLRIDYIGRVKKGTLSTTRNLEQTPSLRSSYNIVVLVGCED